MLELHPHPPQPPGRQSRTKSLIESQTPKHRADSAALANPSSDPHGFPESAKARHHEADASVPEFPEVGTDHRRTNS
eukprot:13051853-Alexandrium_andersonii.AAC.1